MKQIDIAKHLGVTQPAVSKILSKLGMDAKKNTLEEIRLSYIEHLRNYAAGHASPRMMVMT